jgi:hypothetical protein
MLNEQVESVMAIAFELARIREEHGAQSGMYLSEVRALRAEAERLAAQAAPTEAEYNPLLIDGVQHDPLCLKVYRSPLKECDCGASSRAAQPSQAPVVQAVQAGEYPPLPWGNQQPYVWFCRTKDTDLVAAFRAYVDADRASSGAAQAAPFAKDSWQHAVDNQLVAFGRTSQEFANPHEALAWLAIVNMELGQSNVGAAQAVRMLTREELNDVALSEQVGWGPGEYVEAIQRKFCEVNKLRIPADGVIGGA